MQNHDLTNLVARGGVFTEDDDFLAVIDSAKQVEEHSISGHYMVYMDNWKTISRGRTAQWSATRDEWGASFHAALMADGRWLCWYSKTDVSPATFEVKETLPSRWG